MWRMSNAKALIFIAAILIAVAMLVLWPNVVDQQRSGAPLHWSL